MHKFTNTLTPAQVYLYAVECCQPHLKLRDAKRVTARMLLTILFAAAARISSLSDTCKRLRGVPDEEVVAAALYETLPDYNLLKRQVNAALAGHLPKPLRKQAQIVALDLTLLPFYGADAKENDQIYRVRSRQCQGFPRNPGRFHPESGLSPSLDQLGAIEREASFL